MANQSLTSRTPPSSLLGYRIDDHARQLLSLVREDSSVRQESLAASSPGSLSMEKSSPRHLVLRYKAHFPSRRGYRQRPALIQRRNSAGFIHLQLRSLRPAIRQSSSLAKTCRALGVLIRWLNSSFPSSASSATLPASNIVIVRIALIIARFLARLESGPIEQVGRRHSRSPRNFGAAAPIARRDEIVRSLPASLHGRRP